MKYNKQLLPWNIRNGVAGDCHRTAIACILNLEPEQVPHFGVNPDITEEEFFNSFNVWLEINYNLNIVYIAFDTGLENILEMMAVRSSSNYYLLLGISSPGADHTVVAKGGKIIWDPSPNNCGIIGPMTHGYYEVGLMVPLEY